MRQQRLIRARRSGACRSSGAHTRATADLPGAEAVTDSHTDSQGHRDARANRNARPDAGAISHSVSNRRTDGHCHACSTDSHALTNGRAAHTNARARGSFCS